MYFFRFLRKFVFLLILILNYSIHASSDQSSSDSIYTPSDQLSSGITSKSKYKHGLFTMRLKNGFNLATLWGSTSKSYENRTLLPGFTACAALGLRLFKYFSIQPEILFTMKGYKTKKTVNNNSQTEIIKKIIRLNYLEFPILPKLTLPFSAGYFHVYCGPKLGIKIGVNSYINRDLNKEKYTETIPEEQIELMNDGIKKSDFGLVAGITLDIGKGTDLFIVDIRYALGLKEIIKLNNTLISEVLTEQDIYRHKTNSISLNIGYGLIF